LSAGDGGDVDVSWDTLKFLKSKVEKIEFSSGAGGDAFLRGLNKAVEEEKANKKVDKTAKDKEN
jgi:hypothetical protein